MLSQDSHTQPEKVLVFTIKTKRIKTILFSHLIYVKLSTSIFSEFVMVMDKMEENAQC